MAEQTGYCYPMHVIRWYFKHVIDDFAKEFRLKKELAAWVCASVRLLCMYECVCVCGFGNELTRFFHTPPVLFPMNRSIPYTISCCTRKVVNLRAEKQQQCSSHIDIDIIMIVKQLWVWERAIGQIALASIWAVKFCILTLYFSRFALEIILQHHRKIGGL